MISQQEIIQRKGSYMVHIHKDGHTTKLQVLIQPNIGLDSDVRQSVVNLLNITLADEAVLIAKTRSAHWNVRGGSFFELHSLFGTHYQILNNISDEIAERTRMLGGYADSSLTEFLSHTRLEEQPGVIPETLHILADQETTIRYMREDVRKCAEEFEDEGTAEMMVGIMRLHEKMAWMLRSYTGDESVMDTKPVD
jgi:starvation-inducible DNA-binding protein